MGKYIRWFETLRREDVAVAGGKCASLGEMIQRLEPDGIKVPGGFAVTVDAYRHFLTANDLDDFVQQRVAAYDRGDATLQETGSSIRDKLIGADIPDDIREAISEAYATLSERYGDDNSDVACRSSATAEDLPDASFAGQQETFLNVQGADAVVSACKHCFASLFTDRAISYRRTNDFDHIEVGLSVAVQKMIRSDRGAAGVMFTLETETGFPDMVVIDGSWGLGESVVGGLVTPDEFRIFKPLLGDESVTPIVERRLGAKETRIVYDGRGTRSEDTPRDMRNQWVLDEDEILQLARWAVTIEKHYDCPMDIEWGKDGDTGELYILQARPETVQSRVDVGNLQSFKLKGTGPVLVEGTAVGSGIGTGVVRVLRSPADAHLLKAGEILVAPMTDPDWVPIMQKAAAIVTNHGGRTSHAAIVSREIGIPAVVGTNDATDKLSDGMEVTVSCAEGDRGYVYEGELEFETSGVSYEDLPETRTQIMMIVGSPQTAYRWWRVPSEGIGLARMEFIINNVIRAHPLALIHFDELADPWDKKEIQRLTRGYDDKTEYFVDRLSRAMARIAAAEYPNPVIVRMSDFKSNEYADLVGGRSFEPDEANPMLGFRGASRYYSKRYRAGFALECQALKRARDQIGLTNIIPMIPFCRTPWEADKVLEEMSNNGLVRGENGLQVYVMVEVPSNVILADQFAERFDGFSIGSNDLTQLVLGVDRDSGDLAHLFDARQEAVSRMIEQVIGVAREKGVKIGICGQAPSDHPEFAEFLVKCGIDSIAVNPDSLVTVRQHVAKAEADRT